MTIMLPGVQDSLQPALGTLPIGVGGPATGVGAAPSKRVRNFSVTSQAVPAATRTYLTGSALAIPADGLKVGTKLSWTFNMTKTAAGSAASTFDIAFGVNGTIADTAQVSFVKPAGTAAADEAWVDIEARVQTVGATGVVIGEFAMTHNLASTGHAATASVNVNAVSAGFDNRATAANTPYFVGICLTSGAADAITVAFMDAEVNYV
jgi:hypothetical protein